jgi:hypothetical protein
MKPATLKDITGGAASPMPERVSFNAEPGATMLDAFAMVAWSGVHASAQKGKLAFLPAELAEIAYGHAVAMLAEKRRRESGA